MNDETILLRQVNPSWIEKGVITSQAFIPFPKDDGRMSVYDGDQIEPAGSHEHFVGVLGFASCGVWGVTVTEAGSFQLTASPDPLEQFPEHAIIDFTGHEVRTHRGLAKKLKAKAIARGCLFEPDPVAENG